MHEIQFGSQAYVVLATLSESLDDTERARIASENRVRAAQQGATMLPEKHVAVLQAHVDAIITVELDAAKALTKHFKAEIPLYEWVADTAGLGERQAARLLGVIGDPAQRENPSQLRQYCGHGDPERSHCRRGQDVHHSPAAKMRVHLIAVSCMKCRQSPYRDVYDEAREAWVDKTHSKPCVRCGPKGKPALEGSPVSDGHAHAHALRIVGKELLLDMWVEARRLAGLTTITGHDREAVAA